MVTRKRQPRKQAEPSGPASIDYLRVDASANFARAAVLGRSCLNSDIGKRQPHHPRRITSRSTRRQAARLSFTNGSGGGAWRLEQGPPTRS